MPTKVTGVVRFISDGEMHVIHRSELRFVRTGSSRSPYNDDEYHKINYQIVNGPERWIDCTIRDDGYIVGHVQQAASYSQLTALLGLLVDETRDVDLVLRANGTWIEKTTQGDPFR